MQSCPSQQANLESSISCLEFHQGGSSAQHRNLLMDQTNPRLRCLEFHVSGSSAHAMDVSSAVTTRPVGLEFHSCGSSANNEPLQSMQSQDQLQSRGSLVNISLAHITRASDASATQPVGLELRTSVSSAIKESPLSMQSHDQLQSRGSQVNAPALSLPATLRTYDHKANPSCLCATTCKASLQWPDQHRITACIVSYLQPRHTSVSAVAATNDSQPVGLELQSRGSSAAASPRTKAPFGVVREVIASVLRSGMPHDL